MNILSSEMWPHSYFIQDTFPAESEMSALTEYGKFDENVSVVHKGLPSSRVIISIFGHSYNLGNQDMTTKTS